VVAISSAAITNSFFMRTSLERVCEPARTLCKASGGFCDVGHEIGQGGPAGRFGLAIGLRRVIQVTFRRAAAGLAFRRYFGRLP
jgi:hypothetical protein